MLRKLLQSSALVLFATTSFAQLAQDRIPQDDGGPEFVLTSTISGTTSDAIPFSPPTGWVPTQTRDIMDVELVWAKNEVDSFACDTIDTDVVGKMALIRRGGCAFVDKALNALNAGAVSFMVCNTADRDMIPAMGGTTEVGIPGVMLAFGDCENLVTNVDAGTTVNMSLTADRSTQINSAYIYNYAVVPESQTNVTQYYSPTGFYANLTETDSIFTGTLTQTSPSGASTVLATVVDTIQPYEQELIRFDAADVNIDFSEGVGNYAFEISSDLSADATATFGVEVTEDYFQSVRNGSTLRGLAPTAASYFDQSNSTMFISMPLIISTRAEAKSYSFDICNAAELIDTLTNSYPAFEALIIDVDADDDFIFDEGNGVSIGSFDNWMTNSNLIGFGEYAMDGTETCADGLENLITVDLEPDGVSEDSIILKPGKIYLAALLATSDGIGNQTVAPSLAGIDDGGNDFHGIPFVDPNGGDTLNLQNRYLELDQLYSGFTGAIHAQRVTIADASLSGTSVPQLAGSIELMPNPATEQTQLSLDLPSTATNIELNIYSMLGQRVAYQQLEDAAQQNFDISVANLPSGNYLVHITSDQGVRTLQLQVAH